MSSTREALVQAIQDVTKFDSQDIDQAITKPKDSKHGDLAFPCFLVAKELKTSPRDCAIKLADEIELPQSFSKVEPIGPYLNFFLDRNQEIKAIINTILSEKLDYGKDASNKDRNIVVEYSAPNIAKPFHIGHLRTTIIGFALDNIFRQRGYNAISVNHLGDWGTQFGFVYAGCEFWGKPDDGDVEKLVQLYIEANIVRKQQDENNVADEYADFPDVNQVARDYFLRLESKEPEAVAFWEWCVDVSMKYFKKIYAELGISFDHYTGESFYMQFLPEIKEKLRKSKILKDSEGAQGIDLGEKLGFARLITEDGRSLYLTRDIVTVDYREKTFSPEKILYIVGAPQTLHFQQIKAVMEKMNHPAADKVIHIAYGHVPGIGTRSMKGSPENFSLSGLLKEGQERALDAYRHSVTKRPVDVDEVEVSKSVALAAIYFNYLCRTNIKDFHFTWKEALNFQGDTGPYLLYALARLNSIARNAKEAGLEPSEEFDSSLLNKPETYQIISMLSDFPGVLDKITEDYEPNHLAQYALNLAKFVAKNYKVLRVIGEDNKDLAIAHLTLFAACKYVLEISIRLLGIPPIERM